jgi:hypothetical protein
MSKKANKKEVKLPGTPPAAHAPTHPAGHDSNISTERVKKAAAAATVAMKAPVPIVPAKPAPPKTASPPPTPPPVPVAQRPVAPQGLKALTPEVKPTAAPVVVPKPPAEPPKAAPAPQAAPAKPQPPAKAAPPTPPSPVKVAFVLHAPKATRVSVCGEFNRWSPDASPLKQLEDGRWQTTLALQPGRYQYKFVADGQWIHDPQARENVPNEHGSLNSVIEVRA